MLNLATIWIVDRDPRRRTALARLAGTEHPLVLGTPEDSSFNSAALPKVVVIGLSSDFEAELDFVHRMHARVGDCGWVLIAENSDRAELKRLFDTLDARILGWPPSASGLRRTLRSLGRVRSAAPLSQRTGRESLSVRFARWFSGDELHWLLRTLDPSLASVPVLVRGETGTGRRLLARYIHAFGSEPGAAFVPVFCQGVRSAAELLSQLDIAELRTPGRPPISAVTIWLDEVDQLPPPLQKRLQTWIDFGTPHSAGLSNLRIRWTASAGEESAEEPEQLLQDGLGQALSGLVIRLAPLRDSPDAIERFAEDTAAAWCEERGSRQREFAPEALQALAVYPWPGNLRELESVVCRTLAGCSSPLLTAEELRFDAGEEPGGLDPFGEPEAAAIDTATDFPPAAERAAEASDDLDEAADDEELSVEAELESHEIESLEYHREALDADIEDAVGRDETNDPVVSDESWARILRSVAHEVRNPLVSIRTFSEMLPEHHHDAEFRERFGELVGADVRRIEGVVARLQQLSELSHAKRTPVNLATLLDELLQERRETVDARHLLVLKELDTSHPMVLSDEELLRGAFAGILNRALEWVPEHGDLYLASRHRDEAPGQSSNVRVLLRFQGISATGHPAPGGASTLAESTLEFVAARAVILGLGGAFTCDATDRETVVVVDLPAPPD